MDLIFNNQNFFRAHTDLSTFGIDTSLDAHPRSSVSTPAGKSYGTIFTFAGKKNIASQDVDKVTKDWTAPHPIRLPSKAVNPPEAVILSEVSRSFIVREGVEGPAVCRNAAIFLHGFRPHSFLDVGAPRYGESFIHYIAETGQRLANLSKPQVLRLAALAQDDNLDDSD